MRFASVLFALVLSVGLLYAFYDAKPAEAVAAGFDDRPVVSGAGLPTALAFTPDGRMLVADKLGRLRVYRSLDGKPLANPALDLSARTCSNLERGLLGVAVDPLFGANRYVYVYYTHDKFGLCPEKEPGNARNPVNRVSRFVMNGNTIDPASETVLIDNIPSPNGNHNGGDVRFGKDGLLYVSVGDGGCDYAQPTRCGAFNDAAQDRGVLVGKILRVTRSGGIPQDNPYRSPDISERCGNPGNDGRAAGGKRCQEIFAHGLRNPFRMAFDPDARGTRFFINDVGQALWEEVDRGRRGANYGWNLCEGRHDNTNRPGSANCAAAALNPPVWEYNHSTGCESITGGAFVANAARWPASYDSSYLYADFVCNRIFKLTPRDGGGFTRTTFAMGPRGGGIVALDFGPYGQKRALYYTTFANDGQIRRINYTGR